MSDAARVRAFLALPPDPDWGSCARGLLARIRPGLPEASWTRPETWHVTIRFLGEVARSSLSEFTAAISRAAVLSGADLRSRGAAIFPPRGAPRVLGVDLDPGEGGLPALASAAESAARAIGVAPENRPFRPHVTFARLRRAWPREAVAKFAGAVAAEPFPVWPARRCVLYESRLASGGAIHTPIQEWALGTRAATA